jgi:glycosyltransferase involved in cell wall biosynthesis
MRILHLAYEDPRQPGAGGGSIRAREINRRLSERHEITALVAGYPGARRRVEGGLEWIPIGLRASGKAARLSYFAVAGPHVALRRHDLVVEEFGAPFSVGPAPSFTRTPIVASVQWLFAEGMKAKYRLPFDAVERRGLGRYGRFIAVSSWLAAELERRNPDATVVTIPNGVDPLAFAAPERPREHLVFVGRLDVAHKGIDLLLEAMTSVKQALGARMPPLVIVGDGPDERKIRDEISRRSLADVVLLRGRLEGLEKYELMAGAYAVLMPSRWETFGMVAVEALAVGAPVVAFDVGPLRDVVCGAATLIEPYDVPSFARAVIRLVEGGQDDGAARDRRRAVARRYDWDAIAHQQERAYVDAVENWAPGRTTAVAAC